MAGEIVDAAKENSTLFAVGLAERIRGEALTTIGPERRDEAETYFASSLAKFEEGSARLEGARTRVAWSRAMAQRGNMQAAREQLERAAVQFSSSGLIDELDEVQRLVRSLPT